VTDSPGPRLRLTVLGCSTAAPHEATATAGYLVQWGETSVLLDVGQGVIRNLQRVMDPRDLTAVVVGHMHADHFLDLVGLRYLFPWGEPARHRMHVNLPPGGRARLSALAAAISERSDFFDSAFDTVEYDPTTELTIGDLRLRFFEGRHYVPAWGVVIEAPDGARLAYTGDTGPSTDIESLACGTPVIARRIGALPEILRDGVDGFFGDDVTAMAFKVDRVVDLDRRAIRESVLDRFSVERMTDRYLAVYRARLEAPEAEVRADAAGESDDGPAEPELLDSRRQDRMGALSGR
jgi:hypothetical protein